MPSSSMVLSMARDFSTLIAKTMRELYEEKIDIHMRQWDIGRQMCRDGLFKQTATTYDYSLTILCHLGPVDLLKDNTDLADLSPKTVQEREYHIRMEKLFAKKALCEHVRMSLVLNDYFTSNTCTKV